MSAFLDSKALPAFSMKGTPNTKKKEIETNISKLFD
jgi:hypothetical protein